MIAQKLLPLFSDKGRERFIIRTQETVRISLKQWINNFIVLLKARVAIEFSLSLVDHF